MARPQYLYGLNPVIAALTAKRRVFSRLLVAPPVEEKMHVFELAKTVVKVEHVTRDKIERFAMNKPHQGLILQASEFPIEFLTTPESLPNVPILLCLDRVSDPQNYGAILRSAYFLGVSSLITTRKFSCPISPTVSKVSSGAVEFMRVFEVESLPEFLKECKRMGITVVAAGRGTPVMEWKGRIKGKRTILVLGSEGDGVRKAVLEECQGSVFVPGGSGPIDSLNVSCAAAILLYELIQ